MDKSPKNSVLSIGYNQKRQNILLEISKSIISTLDYKRVLQIISDGMSELLEIETAAIYLIEDDEHLYLGSTTPPLPPDLPDTLRRIALKDHLHIKQTITSRTSLNVQDTKKEPLTPTEEAVVKMRNLRSLLYFPFIQEEHVLGVLILGTCNKVRLFSSEEIELGQTVANQLSIGIQNARLHHDLQEKNIELEDEIQVRKVYARELKLHKENLEQLVKDKTSELDEAIEELKTINNQLHLKNDTIEQQNGDLKEALKNLRETQALLIQSEKMASLGVLTAGVAHEINNPLNFISGACEGIKTNLQKEKVNIQKGHYPALFDAIKTGLDRTQKIVKSLSQFSLDNNITTEDCFIHLIIDNCLTILQYQLKDKIEIEKNYSETRASVKGNVGNLHQVFLNILTNAIQAIDGTGQITISVSRKKNNIVTTISDTGIGIRKENLSKITDPFFTTKSPGDGTGLGLSIVYKILKTYKGSLQFESEINNGTTATVILPIQK